MGDLIYFFVFVVLIIALVAAFAVMGGKRKKYMEDQRQNNTDKQRLLDLMSRAMEENYSKYTYAVGYFTKVKQRLNVTTYYYFPYVLAFTPDEMVIFSFVKQNGELYLRNRLPVDWNSMKFKYKLTKKGVLLTFKMMGETMPIRVDAVIASGGEEKSDRPICVYQEQEVEKLRSYLEGYAQRANS